MCFTLPSFTSSELSGHDLYDWYYLQPVRRKTVLWCAVEIIDARKAPICSFLFCFCTALCVVWIKRGTAFVCFSFFFIFFATCARLSWLLSFRVHVKLLYRIVSCRTREQVCQTNSRVTRAGSRLQCERSIRDRHSVDTLETWSPNSCVNNVNNLKT